MKINIRISLQFLFLVFISACSSQNNPKEENLSDENLRKKASEITANAQSVLVQNLTSAINEGGPASAVRFCNIRASYLSDSLSKLNDCSISRISMHNRNPENKLTTQADSAIWNFYMSDPAASTSSDTLIHSSGRTIFYKPIKIGMPLCLNCHGKPGQDIQNETLAVIDSLYPNDLAVNYESGQLRGLWKIDFTRK